MSWHAKCERMRRMRLKFPERVWAPPLCERRRPVLFFAGDYSNRLSPPGHEGCTDALCLRCIEAETYRKPPMRASQRKPCEQVAWRELG